jgi:hypothetical protein
MAAVTHSDTFEVRFEALCAAMEYASFPHDVQSPAISGLVAQMLQTLPSVPKVLLPMFISPLKMLVFARPLLFQPHLNDLLTFFGPFVMTDTGECKTPTEDKPATEIPSNFGDAMSQRVKDDDEEVSKEARKAVLEFMIDLSTVKSAIVRDVEGWIPAVIRSCLEGMADVSDYGDLELMEDDVRRRHFLQYLKLRYCNLFCNSPMTTRLKTPIPSSNCAPKHSFASVLPWEPPRSSPSPSSAFPPC